MRDWKSILGMHGVSGLELAAETYSKAAKQMAVVA